MTEQPTEKTCTKCGETKPLDEFSMKRTGAQGRSAQCRPCATERQRERYAARAAERARLKQKKCRYCHTRKPPHNFTPSPTKDGLSTMCTECQSMRQCQTSKICTRCGEEKPLEEYVKDRKKMDGRASSCRACENARIADHYQRNRGRILASQRKYREEQPERVKASKDKWRSSNREAVREASRRYYAENREARRERHRRYYAENRTMIAARGARYVRENPHIMWASKYRARCRQMSLPITIEGFTKEDVIAKYGDACMYCETGGFENLDHFIPVSKGGPHTLENVRPSCFACNRAKSDADPEEWLAEQAEFDALTEDEQNALIDAEIAKYLNEED